MKQKEDVDEGCVYKSNTTCQDSLVLSTNDDD